MGVASSSQRRVQVVVEPVTCELPLPPVADAVALQPLPAILESQLPSDLHGRYSLLAWSPVRVIEIGSPADRGSLGRLLDALRRELPPAATADAPPRSAGGGRLPQCAAADTLPRVAADAPPTACGWIGFLAYELGAAAHGVLRDSAVPAARFHLYDTALVYDHHRSCWFVQTVENDCLSSVCGSSVRQRLAAARRLLEETAQGEWSRDAQPVVGVQKIARASLSWTGHRRCVEHIRESIAAGDAYEVNLAVRFETACVDAPHALYRRLRHANPGTHAAYLAWDDTAVLCGSPELFLDLRDGVVTTRPIKGTRPRHPDPAQDNAHRAALEGGAKERAELNMIIDLMRNDLGRVCRYGSVAVVSAGEIETYSTVHHRTATIVGQMQPGRDFADLLEAAFPGGSITGAPKIRALQIIRELEPTERGVYCGSIGRIGVDGSMSMNIAIRTMVQQGERLWLYGGGAIVADSDPESEYTEIMAKVSGLMQAAGCRTEEAGQAASQATTRSQTAEAAGHVG